MRVTPTAFNPILCQAGFRSFRLWEASQAREVAVEMFEKDVTDGGWIFVDSGICTTEPVVRRFLSSAWSTARGRDTGAVYPRHWTWSENPQTLVDADFLRAYIERRG